MTVAEIQEQVDHNSKLLKAYDVFSIRNGFGSEDDMNDLKQLTNRRDELRESLRMAELITEMVNF